MRIRLRRRKKTFGKIVRTGQILVASGALTILIIAVSKTWQFPQAVRIFDMFNSKLTPDMIAVATAAASLLLLIAVVLVASRRSKQKATMSSLVELRSPTSGADAEKSATTENQTPTSSLSNTAEVITPVANKAEQIALLSSIARLEELAASMAQKATAAPVDLSADTELRELIASQIDNVISRDLIQTIRERYGIDRMESSFADSKSRISGVMNSLRFRNKAGILTAFLFAVCGIGCLAFFVMKNPLNQVSGEQIVDFVPRMALILILEMLAYFCLNLYKHGLRDLRYYQNEMTNIESREAALHAALLNGNESQIGGLVAGLFATDRNAVHVIDSARVYRTNGSSDQLVAMEAIGQIADLARKMS